MLRGDFRRETRKDEDTDSTRRDVIKEQVNIMSKSKSDLLNLVGCFDQLGHTVQPVKQVLSAENSEYIVSTTHICVCLRVQCVWLYSCMHAFMWLVDVCVWCVCVWLAVCVCAMCIFYCVKETSLHYSQQTLLNHTSYIK